MKILEIVYSIPPNKLDNHSRKACSGYDLMAYEIAERLANQCNNAVDLYTLVQFHRCIQSGNLRILKNSKTGLIVLLLSCYFLKSLWSLRRYLIPLTRKSFIDIVYQSLALAKIRILLMRSDYEVIHVHGCMFLLDGLYKIADKQKKQVVVTLHGLVSFNSLTRAHNALRRYERDFLRQAYEQNRIVSFVSTGCIHTVQDYLGVKETPHFVTTVNGCVLNKSVKHKINIRERYGLAADAKILLYVGNISNLKNQVMALRAVNQCYNQSVFLLLLGEVYERYSVEWEKLKEKYNTQGRAIECGFISSDNLGDYYSQADGVMLISKCEGFGLSLIEGMSFGLPCIVANNMEIVPDIYDKESMILANNQSVDSVSAAIADLINKDWNKDYIRSQASHFSMENMADRYHQLLYRVKKYQL